MSFDESWESRWKEASKEEHRNMITRLYWIYKKKTERMKKAELRYKARFGNLLKDTLACLAEEGFQPPDYLGSIGEYRWELVQAAKVRRKMAAQFLVAKLMSGCCIRNHKLRELYEKLGFASFISVIFS